VGALKYLGVAMSLALVSPAAAETVADWRPHIHDASARFGVPVIWIERVMRAESGGRTSRGGRPIRSSAGAMGLMQLMPGTWAEMRARLRLGDDPDNPRDNILAGTFYLRLMYDRFGYPGLFGAYNAGPRRYADHLASGRPLPGETVGYLAAVAPSASTAAVAAIQAVPPQSIFAVRRNGSPAEADQATATPPASLFVVLSQRE
jgi:soluble lytic murein transglycosylase-like protein